MRMIFVKYQSDHVFFQSPVILSHLTQNKSQRPDCGSRGPMRSDLFTPMNFLSATSLLFHSLHLFVNYELLTYDIILYTGVYNDSVFMFIAKYSLQ